jgi:hypothetical protein
MSDILDILELDMENRLQDFSNQQLTNLLNKIAQNMNKRDLSNLLCDDKYFSMDTIIKSLEKNEKNLLFNLLNEPNKEKELRNPIERWLKEDDYRVTIEVPYKIGKNKRLIDVLGWKNVGVLSRSLFSGWLDKEFIAVESKIKASRGAIDQAFSQANDYTKCAKYCYVAISPYIFLKYKDVIEDKMNRFENIGVLLVDKSRVIKNIKEPEETEVDRETFEQIKQYLKL